ncbi:keratin-associated protein 5-8-like [Mya arenaria]|uniref:keratin-associated protein 5-8-like n=1 Tax=Mya arenaria TaxID=6604 RepID=UPI0022E13D3E|nr:keratin-associated protein 5-8-like [Mya arenaria]
MAEKVRMRARADCSSDDEAYCCAVADGCGDVGQSACACYFEGTFPKCCADCSSDDEAYCCAVADGCGDVGQSACACHFEGTFPKCCPLCGENEECCSDVTCTALNNTNISANEGEGLCAYDSSPTGVCCTYTQGSCVLCD